MKETFYICLRPNMSRPTLQIPEIYTNSFQFCLIFKGKLWELVTFWEIKLYYWISTLGLDPFSSKVFHNTIAFSDFFLQNKKKIFACFCFVFLLCFLLLSFSRNLQETLLLLSGNIIIIFFLFHFTFLWVWFYSCHLEWFSQNCKG